MRPIETPSELNDPDYAELSENKPKYLAYVAERVMGKPKNEAALAAFNLWDLANRFQERDGFTDQWRVDEYVEKLAIAIELNSVTRKHMREALETADFAGTIWTRQRAIFHLVELIETTKSAEVKLGAIQQLEKMKMQDGKTKQLVDGILAKVALKARQG